MNGHAEYYITAGFEGLAKSVWADLDGTPVTNGQVIDLFTLALGDHTLTVYAIDNSNNQSTASVTFTVSATLPSLRGDLGRFFAEGKIDNRGVYNSLMVKLIQAENAMAKGKYQNARNLLNAFISEVQAQSGKHITPEAAAILIADANWVISGIPLSSPVITAPKPQVLPSILMPK